MPKNVFMKERRAGLFSIDIDFVKESGILKDNITYVIIYLNLCKRMLYRVWEDLTNNLRNISSLSEIGDSFHPDLDPFA